MAGVGPLEIPLEEGYRAKDWTIQLRWPHEMVDFNVSPIKSSPWTVAALDAY